jgi:hypothetical protein
MINLVNQIADKNTKTQNTKAGGKRAAPAICFSISTAYKQHPGMSDFFNHVVEIIPAYPISHIPCERERREREPTCVRT